MDTISGFFERILAALMAICCTLFPSYYQSKNAQPIDTIQFEIGGDAYEVTKQSNLSIHDPSLMRAEDGTYYIYGSHIASAKSDNLLNWTNISAGIHDNNRTLVPEGSTLREALSEPLNWTDNVQVHENDKISVENHEGIETNVWAADVFYNKAMKKYCYYASSSVWGTSSSVIWFATSDTPDGTFEYQNSIVYSGFNKRLTAGKHIKFPTYYGYTNVQSLLEEGAFTRKNFEKSVFFNEYGFYSNWWATGPNCIDPHVFYDKNDELWMVYGSWSGGIYILPLNEETGLTDYNKAKKLKGYVTYYGVPVSFSNEGTGGTGEGPYIVYNPETDYYYFFITYGGLGRNDGYNIREYRSKNPYGPYEDICGNIGTDMKNTGLKISGNGTVEGVTYMSPGHNSVFIDNDGKAYNCYHVRYGHDYYYFDTKINQMLTTKDGWMVTLPIAYTGETAANMDDSKIVGTYSLTDFGNTTVDGSEDEKIIYPQQTVTFNEDGTVTGFTDYVASAHNTKESSEEVEGFWTMESGSYYISMDLGSVHYEGVAVKNNNEKLMLSFAGNDNSCIWAVK